MVMEIPPKRYHEKQVGGKAGWSVQQVAPRSGSSGKVTPLNGSPIRRIPDDILVEVFKMLELHQVLHLKRVDKRFNALCQSPSLYSHLDLTSSSLTLSQHHLPSSSSLHPWIRPQPVRQLFIWDGINPRIRLPSFASTSSYTSSSDRDAPPGLLSLLPHARSIHITPSTTLSTCSLTQILSHLPSTLETLHIPFLHAHLCPPSFLSCTLARLGTSLRYLDLRASAIVASPLLTLGVIAELCPSLESLDLSYTLIGSLPTTTQGKRHPFPRLRKLALRCCLNIPIDELAEFLTCLPPDLEELDIGEIENLTLPVLLALQVTQSTRCALDLGCLDPESMSREMQPNSLKSVDVRGIDWLTRRDLRDLKAHWQDVRQRAVRGESEVGAREDVEWLSGQDDTYGLSTPSSSWSGTSVMSSLGGLITPPVSPQPIRARITHFSSSPSSSPSSSYSSSPSFSEISPRVADRKWAKRERRNEAVAVVKEIELLATAVLETDDEEGYRRYLSEIAGAEVML